MLSAIFLAWILFSVKSHSFIANTGLRKLPNRNRYNTESYSELSDDEESSKITPRFPDLSELEGVLEKETPDLKRIRICENDQFGYELFSKACTDEYEVLSRMGIIGPLKSETLEEAIVRARYELRRPKPPDTIFELIFYLLESVRNLFCNRNFKQRDFQSIAKAYCDRLESSGQVTKIDPKFNLISDRTIELCTPAIADRSFLSNSAVLGFVGHEVYDELHQIPIPMLEKVLLVMNNVYKTPMLYSNDVGSEDSEYSFSGSSDGLVWKDHTTIWLAKKQSFIGFIRYYPRSIFPIDIPSSLLLFDLFGLGDRKGNSYLDYFKLNLTKPKSGPFPLNLPTKCTLYAALGWLSSQVCSKLISYAMLGKLGSIASYVASNIDTGLLSVAFPALSLLVSLKGKSPNNDDKFIQLMKLMEKSLYLDMGKPDQIKTAVSELKSKLPKLKKTLVLDSHDLIEYTIMNMVNLQMIPGLQIGPISGRLLESQLYYKPVERSYLLALLHLIRMVPLEGNENCEPPDSELSAVTDKFHKSLPLPRDVYMPHVSRDADYLKESACKRFNKIRRECWEGLKMNHEIDKAFIDLAERLDTTRWFIFDFALKGTFTAFIAALTREVYPEVRKIYGGAETPQTHFSDLLGVYRTEEKMDTEGPIKRSQTERINDSIAAILENGQDPVRLREPDESDEETPKTTEDSTTKKLTLPEEILKTNKLSKERLRELAAIYGIRESVVYPLVLRAFRELALFKEIGCGLLDDNSQSCDASRSRVLLLGEIMGVNSEDALNWSRCLGYRNFSDDLSTILDEIFEKAPLAIFQPQKTDEDVIDNDDASYERRLLGHGGPHRQVDDQRLWTREEYPSSAPKFSWLPNLIEKLDGILEKHKPGKYMFVNTLSHLLRIKALALRKAMKAARDMRDTFLAARHVNGLLILKQSFKLLSAYYDLPMRYRINGALFDNFHPYHPIDLAPGSHTETKSASEEDYELEDPEPDPTMLELANRRYFRMLKDLASTTIYPYDSKIPYFIQQRELKRIKDGEEPDPSFKFDPDTFYFGRKFHDKPNYNVELEEDQIKYEGLEDKTFNLGFGKAIALHKIVQMPILSPSDEFYLAVAYTSIYPENYKSISQVLPMIASCVKIVVVEAAKAYLRRKLETFAPYDLKSFDLKSLYPDRDMEEWIKEQLYEERCAIAGGVDLTSHLDNPAGCNDGIFQTWNVDVTNRLEHYYATKKPDNMKLLQKTAEYFNLKDEIVNRIHDKTFWRVYQTAPVDLRPKVAAELGLSGDVTKVIDLQTQFIDMHNEYLCKIRLVKSDPKALIDACHELVKAMDEKKLILPNGHFKFSLYSSGNFDLFQAYIFALIELGRSIDMKMIGKVGNVFGYWGESLKKNLSTIGSKMYLSYLKQHFSNSITEGCLKPLEKHNSLFHLSQHDVDELLKLHRSNLVMDEYSPESGWDDLVKVKQIVEPGCIGEYFGLDEARSQQWLINILQESIEKHPLKEFVEFNGGLGLASERSYNWKTGNSLERKLDAALQTLTMPNALIADSAFELSIGADSHFNKCIEFANRLELTEASSELSIALKKVLLLQEGQVKYIRNLYKVKGNVDTLVCLFYSDRFG